MSITSIFFMKKIETFSFLFVKHLIKDCIILCTVKPVLSGHSKIDKTKILMTNGFVCLFALRPKSTAMVIAGRSVHLTTLFSWASLNKQLTSNRAHTFACN